MIRAERLEGILKALVFAFLLLVVLFQMIANRGLFADGSFQLLNLLNSETARASQHINQSLFDELVTSNNEPSRYFAYLFTELPTILAIRLGITNLKVLIDIFSSWLLLSPLIFWGAALFSLRKDVLFWPFVMIFSAVYFGCNFFIIGEYNLALSLSAFSSAVMLRSDKLTKMALILLLGSALLSILSYASTIFFGIFLAYLAYKKTKQRDAQEGRQYWFFLAAIFLASSAGGIWGYLYPAHPENLKSSHDFGILIENMPFWATLIYISILIYVFLSGTREWRSTLSMTLLGFAVLYILIPLQAAPFIAYSARVFMSLLLFALTLLLAWFRFYGQHKIANTDRSKNYRPLRHSILPIFAFFCVVSALDMKSSLEFRHYLDDFRNIINHNTGLLRYETSIEQLPGDHLYGWTWTPPSLSLLLRANQDAAIVLVPESQSGRWQPFDPFQSIPDLSRYYKQK